MRIQSKNWTFVALLSLVVLAAWMWVAQRRVVHAASPELTIPVHEEASLAEPDVSTSSRTDAAQSEVVARKAEISVNSTVHDFVIHVIDANSRDVRGARVSLGDPRSKPAESWRPGHELFFPGIMNSAAVNTAVTDAEGRVSFTDDRSNSEFVLVRADGHAPAFALRTVVSGEQTITLDGPTSITGRVTVDGRPPAARFTLTVHGFRDPSTGWCPAALSLLRSEELGDGRLRVTTDAHGEFAVAGIPAAEVVEFGAPPTHMLRRSPADSYARSVQVTTIARDVVLDLGTLPTIGGVFALAPDPNAPSDRAPLRSVSVRVAQMDSSGRKHESTVDWPLDKQFQVPFAESRIEKFTLEIMDGSDRMASVSRTGPFESDVDLGWIDLRGVPRQFALRVEDSQGQPIAGAKTLAEGRVFGPTGDDGRMRLTLSGDSDEVVVGAFGFTLARTTLRNPAPNENVRRLETANRLRFTLRSARMDALPADIEVDIRMPRIAGMPSPNEPSSFADVHGACSSGGGFGDSSCDLFFGVPPSGTLERSDLPIDTPISCRVSTGWGQVLTDDTVVLARGEQREIEHTLAPFLGKVKGRVVTDKGVPIEGARLSGSRMFGPEVMTNSRGEFELDDVANDAMEINISADGFVRRSIAVSQFIGDGRIELRRARVAWIEVVDALGARIEAEVWTEIEPNRAIHAHAFGPGLYRFDTLPLGAHDVNCKTSGGARASATLAAETDRLTLRVAY